MSSDLTPKDIVGCAGSILYLVVVLPIWLYLVYQILTRVDASTQMWVSYWVYVPANVLVGIFAAFAKMLEEKR